MDEILYPGLQPREEAVDTGAPETGESRRERLERKIDEWLIRWDSIADKFRPRAGQFLAVALLVGALTTAVTVYTPGYAVVVDGQELGVVADTAQFLSVEQRVEERVSEILGYDYTMESQVDFKWRVVDKSRLSSLAGFETYLFNQVDEITQGYVLTVDGQALTVQSDIKKLESILDALKAPYVNENTISADFTVPVHIQYEYIGNDQVQGNLAEVETLLNSNSREAVTYTVKSGNTYSGIATSFDMTVSELMALNPQASLNRLMPGDELTVQANVPYLSVRTVDQVTYQEAIAAPVQYQDDDTMYQGDTKVLDGGAEGLALVNAKVTYLNGMEDHRDITSYQELVAPKTKLVAKGTKERPKTMAKGYFIWPVRGAITSRYGYRTLFGTYNFHGGLDIAVPYGTSVKAADGGRVVTAGWHGSYGNYIIIDHENGKQTYYAHNSKLLVSVGQRVYQGQVIAKAGSTGNSTGTHCHFEVRVNGQRQNPRNYLP